ncbi:ankyrin repeat domain-containing protein 39 isoform X1 [Haemorhous mexicanus]|uniref:ankyrin repeat domain-containing protein 39 isoform X1 n=1 Tax=Haemorhous mexicanus TaxID=30427 RepID=UPI0028BD24EA|nr:ankyrin repeat domain-containing protein 39 isoform X1 [Haemorhous mexicanus]
MSFDSFRPSSALSASLRPFPPPFGSLRPGPQRRRCHGRWSRFAARSVLPGPGCDALSMLPGPPGRAQRAPEPVRDGLREGDLGGGAGRGRGAGAAAAGAARGPRGARPGGHYASRNGHLGVCRLLLERGAPCDARTPGGATPLHRACYCGHRAVTELLLAHGADPAATDGDGRTGLHKAAEQGHRELCALLLRQRPALAALRDARGRSPRDGAHPAVWDLLDT